jgi:NAD(P)H-dependent FMN reductase
MSVLRVVDGYQSFGGEPPLVVAVTSSWRIRAPSGALVRSLVESSRDLATVIPLHTLRQLPHFDVSARSGLPPPVRQTGAMIEGADAVLFCVAEYAEGLPAVVGNLLEWAIAYGFLSGKRVGWFNVASTAHVGLANEILDRALRFAGANIVLRADLPVAATQVSPIGRLADPKVVEAAIAALAELLATPPSDRPHPRHPRGPRP